MIRRERPAARLLVLDPEDRILLFRFTPPNGPAFWATPGGAVDPGESYVEAGMRELREETGIVAAVGDEVARRRVEFVTLEGDPVTADERYFLIRVDDCKISSDGYTDLERRMMTEHRWWNRSDLIASSEIIYPEDIVALVERVASGRRGAL
ncbi:NUDIX hydrolase [Sphingomonas sp. MMS24-J13]|uniref:NUDIX hydrolase n=1 Tax=Sphingomonas sp. MMS24-J13 TaxID=3238686 RepID=UPI00384AFE0F